MARVLTTTDLALTASRQAAATVFPQHRGPRTIPASDPKLSNLGLWHWYEKVPEVFSVVDWIASGGARVSYRPCLDVPGVMGDKAPPLLNPDGTVVATDEGGPIVSPRLAEAAAMVWARVRSAQGGQADLMYASVTCLRVAADGWWFAYRANEDLAYDPNGEEVWIAVGRKAIQERSGMYVVDVGLATGPVKVPMADDDTGGRAIRMWRADPQAPARANSWLSRCNRDLEILSSIYEAVAAVALSRINAGLILAPDDQDPKGAQPARDKIPAESMDILGRPLATDLYEQLADHVEESANTAGGYDRAVPAIVSLDSRLTDKVKWIELARTLDPELGNRIDDLRYRIAIASPAPPERILGIGDTSTFANAELVSEDEFRQTYMPDCELVSAVATSKVLKPDLVAMGFTPAEVAQVRIGYDASMLVKPADRSEAAIKLAALPVPPITPAELREATGLGEFAGPNDDEQLLLLAERLMIASSDYAWLSPLLGLPAPPEVAVVPVQQAAALPVIDLSSTERTAAVALPAATTRSLGADLAAIATRYEDRLAVLFDLIVARMVERANARVMTSVKRSAWAGLRSAVREAPHDARGAAAGVNQQLADDGVDDADLFGGAMAAFAGRFDKMTAAAQRDAVEAAGGDWDDHESDAGLASAAAWGLSGRLLIGQARARFEGAESDDAGMVSGFSVPVFAVRRVSTVAGGDPDPGEGAGGPGTATAGSMASVALGALVLGVLSASGQRVVGWIWEYGDADTRQVPYPEHEELDQTESPLKDDFNGYSISDHVGCQCELRPVFEGEQADDPIAAMATA